MEELLQEHLSRVYLTLGFDRFAELPRAISNQLNRLGDCVACGPGRLEVEASGDGVDIKNFPGKVNAGVFFALEGVLVYFLKTYAAAGNEFFLELSFCRNLICVGGEGA